MEVFSFIFLIFLGAKFLTAKSVNMPSKLGEASKKIEARLDEKLHPHSAFMTGFLRVMANLGVFAFWLVLAANFISHDWVSADSFPDKAGCIGGVALGMIVWFAAFSFGVSRGHGRFSEHTLLRLQHFSGRLSVDAGLDPRRAHRMATGQTQPAVSSPGGISRGTGSIDSINLC